MQLIILGSGTIKTPQIKNCSGYLVNEEMLLDCGPGIWRELGKLNISNHKIKYILLTHFHADHISDLTPVLMERYLLANSINKNLKIIGPPGLIEWMNKFGQVYGEWIQKLPLELIEIKNEINTGQYQIKSLPTVHTKNSLCYRIEDKNKKSLFYSGDSDSSENIIKMAKCCHLGIFEASNTEQTKIDGHLTPEIAAELAQKAGVQKLVLTHFYPEVYEHNIKDIISPIFKGEIIEANDGLIINI